MQSNEIREDEIDLRELFLVIKTNKFWIVFITLLITMLSSAYLYYTPYIYSSYSIIEVKSDKSKSLMPDNFLLDSLGGLKSSEIDKEIELLKTFKMNNLALNSISFNTQYFIEDGYKRVEIYKDTPIVVQNIEILDEDILGKLIIVEPQESGYKLYIENSIKDKILDREIILEDKIYAYEENITNEHLKINIKKIEDTDKKIYLKFNGDNRDIYESIIDKSLIVTKLNKSDFFLKISFNDNIQDRGRLYIDSLVDNFISQSIINNSEQNNKILSFIEDNKRKVKDKLKKSEKLLEEYKTTNQIVNPTAQSETIIKEISQIYVNISQNELKEKLIDNVIFFVNKNIAIDSIAPSLVELNDQATLKLVMSLQELYIQKIALNSEFTNKHPEVKKIKSQIKALKKKISFNLKNYKKTMKDKNQNLIIIKDKYESKLKKLPLKERKLIELKRDYEVNSKIYAFLSKENTQKEIIRVSTLSPYRVIDRAYTKKLPIKPKKSLIILVSIITGLMLGIFFVFFKEFLNDKIRSRSDIEAYTSIPIYGVVPFVKTKELKLEVLNSLKSPFSESYRVLRTNLKFIDNSKKSKVILITSTISAEGKTTTAANLSGILHLANCKVVVINFDMRRPSLHKLFEIQNSTGLSTYLSAKDEIGDIVYNTNYENIDIIPSGAIPPNPSELILSDRVDSLLSELKNRYDYIIIDTPPLGLVSDTFNLFKFSDLNLIIFKENYSKKVFVKDLNNIVKQHDIKNIGVVLNSSKSSNGSYGYGYEY